MASLEQTSKQLRGLENTIKALKQSISDLNNTFISNELVETDQYALLQAYNIKIRDLENNIKRLKVALGGIGNDELGLAQLNKESSSAISDLNKIIQVVNNINKLLSDVEGKTITFNVSTIDPNKIVNDDAAKAAAKEQERIQREQAAQAKAAAREQAAQAKAAAKEQERIQREQAAQAKAEADKIKADQNKTKSDNKTNEQLEKQLTLYTTLEQKMSSLSEQARNLGVNIGDITNRASNLRASINQAFDSKNISNAKIHLEQYSRLIDETSNRIKQQEQAIKQQQQTQKQQADEQKRAIQESNKIIQDQINLIRKVAQVVNNGVNQVIKAIRTVINVISKVTSMVANVVKSITSGIKNILKLLGNFGNRLKGIFTGASRGNEITSTFNTISHSATELRSKILLLKGAFDTLFNGEMAKRGRELLSSVYSLGVLTNNEITNNTLQWAQSLEYAFGISAKGLISDLGEITSLLAGLGFQSEEIAVGSENLILMSRYLASMGAAGGDVDAVTSKIVSGMRGMTTAIDDLGLSVREAEMNSFLKDLKAMGGEFANISTDFSSLNEEARIYVRYAALISQFTRTYDLTNMVNAMDTITGRMQTMSGLVGSIVTTLGQGLLRLVADFAVFIIPVLNSINTFVENMLNRLFNTINKWFSKGFGAGQEDKDYVGLNTDVNQVSPWSGIGDKAAIKNTQDTADAVDDLNKSLDDNTKASKKASGGLQSFDRINNVTTQDSSDLAENLADEFDYSSLFTSMIGDLNAMADKASESYYDKLDKKSEEAIENFKDNLQNWAEEMTGRADFDLGFDWNKIKENLGTIKNNIEHTLSTWGNFFIVLGLKVADDINIGLIITDFTTLIASASTLAATMADVLTPALQKFYDIGLSPIVTYIGEVIDGGIRVFTDELDNWTQWFSDNETLILTFFESLGRVVKAAFETAQPYLDSFFDSITELFTGGNENARTGLTSFMEGFISDESKIIEDVQNTVSTVFDTLQEFGTIAKSILEPVLDIVTELGKAFGEWAVNEGIPWLVDQLKNLGTWLDDHKDQIVELVTTLAGMAWDSFTTFVDLVGKLVTWGVEHPGAVAAIFAGLGALKLGSFFTDAAGGLGSTILQLQTLSAVKGIGGAVAAGGAASGAAGAAGAAGGLAGIGAAAGPILAVVAAIGALIAIIVNLWNISEDFRNTITGIGDKISEYWNKFVDGLTSTDEEGNTTIPILDKLKDAFDNLTTALEPVITLLAQIGGGLITGWLNAAIPAFETLATVLSSVFDILSGVINIFIGLVTLDLGKIFEGLSQIGGGAITAITEVPSQLFGTMMAFVSGFLDQFSEVGADVLNGISEFFTTTIPETFSGLIDSIVQFFTVSIPEFFTVTLPSVFSDLWTSIVGLITETIPNALSAIGTSISTFFTVEVPEFFSGLFESIGTFFTETVPTALGIIAARITFFFTTEVPEFFSNLWQGIIDFFTVTIPNTITNINNSIDELIESIKTFFINLWNGIINFFTVTIPNTITNITQAIGKLIEDIKKFFRNLWDGIVNFLTVEIPKKVNEITKSVGEFLSKIPEKIGEIWNSVINFITGEIPERISKIKDDISGFFDNIKDGIGDFFSGIWDGISSWLDPGKKAYDNELDRLENERNNKNKYADGGIVRTTTSGIIGEAGPEAIIPLSPGKRARGVSLWKYAGDILGQSYQDSINRVKIRGAAPITGYANGGSISGGQLFIANEGGGAELIGNIDGSRKTNVANNKMITDAIYEAVYNALADVYDQTGGTTGQRDTSININGFGLIDRSTLSQLARLLSPYIGANNINIADSNFSI